MENEGEKTVRGEKEGSVSRNGESRERERERERLSKPPIGIHT